MNDVNLKLCKFSSEIVPYMYGELQTSDASAFESHLLECTECTDEFAAVSSARFEVYDWKKSEFDPLPTPVIQIPYGDIEPAASWVDRLRAAFSRPWAVPGLAFAGIAMVSVLAAAVYISQSDVTSVAVDRPIVPADEVRPEPEVVSVEKPPSPAPEKTNERSAEPNARPVKVVATRTAQPKRVSRRADTVAVKVVRPPRRAVPDSRAPRLNEFNDDEDTSLRLAQLFEDIDTKD
jgi:hypothetical protein